MIIFKTTVSDKQVQDYVRPEGTKKYECGAGINCAFCTLKMLGVYNDELEETSKTCGPRYRSGKAVQPQEYLSIAKQVIADMTEERHELELTYEYGQPSTSLAKIVSYLHPSEACFFVYGRTGAGGHAVVLRKNQDGVVELVDPQRGSDDIGKEYGFSPARAVELGIEATPEYYRVQGIPAIEEAMIEQSVLFKYWNSKKELLEDLPNFLVGALMIDSVAGLKMLIDDPASGALATKMEEDEEYPPAPNTKMDVDMQGGGKNVLYITDDEVLDSSKMSNFLKTSLQAIKEEEAAETETEDAVAIQDTKLASPDFSELYTMLSDVIAYPPDKDGNAIVKYLFIQEEEEEEDMEGGVRREDKKKQGVKAAPPKKDTATKVSEKRSRVNRATTAQAKRTTGPPPKTVNELKAEYTNHMKTYAAKMAPLREKLLDNGPPYTTVSDIVNATQFMMKSPAFLELPRTINQFTPGWENPGAGKQCIATGKSQADRPLCWLCGNRTGVFGKKDGKSPDRIWGGKLSICDPLNNRFDCEHVLPAQLMKFFGVIYSEFNEGKTTKKQKSIRELLYDGSCSSCNNAKSDGTYILGTQGTDGKIVVRPNRVNILVDIITFAMKVTTKNKTTVTPCANGSPPITFPIEVKGDESTGWFTSIVTSAVGDKKSYPNLIRALLGEALPGNDVHLRADYVNTRARTGDFSPITNQKPDTAAGYDLRTREQVSRNALESLRSAGLKDELETRITDPARTLISSKLTSVPIRLDGNTPQVEIKEANKPATTAAKAAAERGFPVTIKLPATIDWILSRYVAIFNRMKMLCDKLNADTSFSDDWLVRLNKLYTEPVISIDEYVDIRVRQENNKPSGTEVKDEDEAEGQSDPIYEESEMEGQQFIDDELLNVERNPLDESFNYDELLELPGYTNTRGGDKQHIDISVHRGGRRVIEVDI